jgi:hypothetical protein
MLLKKLLIFIEKWGLVLVVLCLLGAFVFAVGEGMKPKTCEESISTCASIL